MRRDRRFAEGNLQTNEIPISICCTYTIYTSKFAEELHISRDKHSGQMALSTGHKLQSPSLCYKSGPYLTQSVKGLLELIRPIITMRVMENKHRIA